MKPGVSHRDNVHTSRGYRQPRLLIGFDALSVDGLREFCDSLGKLPRCLARFLAHGRLTHFSALRRLTRFLSRTWFLFRSLFHGVPLSSRVSDLPDRNVPWSRNPLIKRQCQSRVLPNWENEPQALWVNADFQSEIGRARPPSLSGVQVAISTRTDPREE